VSDIRCGPFTIDIWHRWDEELVNLAQTWEPKENGLSCYVSHSYD